MLFMFIMIFGLYFMIHEYNESENNKNDKMK